MEVDMSLREQEGAETRHTPLPKGLRYCHFCGEVAGHLGKAKSTCLCEGIPCRYCGVGRVRRPTSDQYVPATGGFMHSPYFMGMSGCRDCMTTVHGAVRDEWISWPGPLASDPSLRVLLDTIKEAGLALGATGALPLPRGGERFPRRGLYAVHGEAQAWDQLGLEKPPDERPLCVRGADTPVPSVLRGRNDLRLASWERGDCDLVRVERELSMRWRPPVRGD
jgi:hypothetical protein